MAACPDTKAQFAGYTGRLYRFDQLYRHFCDAYIPGWEVPKMRPEFFTNQYWLITDSRPAMT